VISEDDYVPRPVRFLDFVVIGVGFVHNLARSLETLTGELMLPYDTNGEIALLYEQAVSRGL
jgi:hypothetical protein